MKKLFLLSIVSLSLAGPWGCGRMSSPTSPASQNNSSITASTVPQAVYASAWSAAGTGHLINPEGIAVDASHNVYATDMYLDEVFKYDGNGNPLAQWGNSGDTTLDQPQGVAVYNGNVYVADGSNARVVEYDPNGNVLALVRPESADGGLFTYPTGISFDQAGNMYVSDNSDEVYEFNSSLQLTNQWGASGFTQGLFNYPVVSAEDNSGDIYVVDNNSDNVVKFNPRQGTSSTWGQSGSQAGQFDGPSDVKLDSQGNVYVVDTGNNRVEVFNSNGTYLTQWGQGGSSSQNLNGPESMSIDSNNNVYVVDNGNQRVVKYTLN
jgi:tripartite motif-containing protein 71